MEERPPFWRVAANILNKQSRTADKVWSSNLEFGICDYSQTISQSLIYINIKMYFQEVECGGLGVHGLNRSD